VNRWHDSNYCTLIHETGEIVEADTSVTTATWSVNQEKLWKLTCQ
jgi:hypothetical protein